jgi:8-oxo-dGTP pyrophosphatase MutT (NUDIX family)
MRRSIAAAALIHRLENGQSQWLVQWNSLWQRFYFVSGHKEPEETFRQCMERELTEELQFRQGIHFNVATEPICHLDYDTWSRSAEMETRYTIELFQVELIGSEALAIVEANPANRWINAQEMNAGKCCGGAPLSETIRRLFPAGSTNEGGNCDISQITRESSC